MEGARLGQPRPGLGVGRAGRDSPGRCLLVGTSLWLHPAHPALLGRVSCPK